MYILYIYFNIEHMLEQLKPWESEHLTLIFSKHFMLTWTHLTLMREHSSRIRKVRCSNTGGDRPSLGR